MQSICPQSSADAVYSRVSRGSSRLWRRSLTMRLRIGLPIFNENSRPCVSTTICCHGHSMTVSLVILLCRTCECLCWLSVRLSKRDPRRLRRRRPRDFSTTYRAMSESHPFNLDIWPLSEADWYRPSYKKSTAWGMYLLASWTYLSPKPRSSRVQPL